MASYWPELDQPSVKQDDVAACGRRALQRLHGLFESREDVGLAERLQAGDRALQVGDATERLRLDDPVRLLVERHHAELVALGQGGCRPQDRFLPDIDLSNAATDAGPAAAHAAVEGVAVAGVHGSRLVDDDDERDIGLLLAVAHAHVDRQRLLERCLLVAARAVAVRSPDHD